MTWSWNEFPKKMGVTWIFTILEKIPHMTWRLNEFQKKIGELKFI